MARINLPAAILIAVLLGFGGYRDALARGSGGGATDPAGTEEAAAAPAESAGLTDAEKSAAGCGVAGAGAVAASYLVGPSEVLMLWGGGMVVPSGSVMLGVVLLAQIGTTFCAIGVLATPTVLWAYDQSGNIAARLAQVSRGIGRQALQLFQTASPEERQVADSAAAH